MFPKWKHTKGQVRNQKANLMIPDKIFTIPLQRLRHDNTITFFFTRPSVSMTQVLSFKQRIEAFFHFYYFHPLLNQNKTKLKLPITKQASS